MATALAVGPFVVLYLLARSGDLWSIRRAFSFSTTIGRVGGAGGSHEVERLVRAPSAVALLTVMVVVTLAIIFVMVAKPTLF